MTLRKAIVRDAAITEVMTLWDRLTLALVGIGSLSPSPLLRQSGNALGDEEQAELRALGRRSETSASGSSTRLLGRWVNVLITDVHVAMRLAEQPVSQPA